MGGDLGARAGRVDRVGVAADDEVVDRVLDVRRRVRGAEQPLVVGLVLAEQQLRRGVGAAGATPPARGGRRARRRRPTAVTVGLGDVVAPRPRVAEPQRREQVQRRRVRAAVVRGDQHQDVVVGALGVLDDDVEVAVLVEDPGVQELVLHVLLAAARRWWPRGPRRGRPAAGTCTGTSGRSASGCCRGRTSTP